MSLIERERGSKTAPFTLTLPGARLGCVRHRRRTLYGLPDRFAPASVPCKPVSKPLAAALALTTQRASLQAAVVGVFLILISSRQACLRPPGAPFFLLRRRKNRGRKTPLRAGGPALRTHPWSGGRGCSRTLYGVPGRLVTASVPCLLVSKPLAASLALTDCCGNAGPPWSAAYSINQSYAARSHSQRCKSQRLP